MRERGKGELLVSRNALCDAYGPDLGAIPGQVKAWVEELTASSAAKLNRFNFCLYLVNYKSLIDLILHSSYGRNRRAISGLKMAHQKWCRRLAQGS